MNRPIEILLVEDNPADVDLTREGLEHGKLRNTLHVVKDGVDALKFLRHEAPFGDAPRPDIILLDLNLPRKDGREVLSEIKSDPSLAVIPVVVLTSSDADIDITQTYQLHANCYVRKPLSFSLFVDIIRSIEIFWFQVVRLPPA